MRNSEPIITIQERNLDIITGFPLKISALLSSMIKTQLEY